MNREAEKEIDKVTQFRKKVYPVISDKFFGKAWGGKDNPGQWKEQTYAGIFYSLFREHDDLMRALKANKHISIIALHCRNILELSVWIDAFGRNADLIRAYYEEGVRDMHDILKSLQNWQERTKRVKAGDDIFSGIRVAANNLGVTDLNVPFTKLADIAKDRQLQHHHAMLYKLLSKLMHATGLAVVTQIDQVSLELKPALAVAASNLFGMSIELLCKQVDLKI